MTEIAQYLQQKGLNSRKEGKELRAETCPFCNDNKWHFYIEASTGAYNCKKCGNAGGFFSLRQHFGDGPLVPALRESKQTPQPRLAGRVEAAYKRLQQDKEAQAYLLGRGFTEITAKRFKLGVEEEGGQKWLTIPHFAGEIPVSIKMRSLPPAEKAFRRVTNTASVLFNQDALKKAEEIIVTEGEFDALALIQAGFENVIGNTLGAGSFAPAWAEQLDGMKKIYLCYDNDAPGQEGARKLARRLGYERCRNILLPAKDAAEYFNGGKTAEQFRLVVQAAQPFRPANMLSLGEAIEEAKTLRPMVGLMTPWYNVNCLTGGFRPGELIVISAPPKIGKTSWCLQVAINNARYDHPVFFYCLEMPVYRLLHKMACCYLHKTDEQLASEDFDKLRATFAPESLIFGRGEYGLTLDSVMDTIRAAVKLYGVELVVFDHLHFLIRSLQHQVQEVGNAVRSFKMLAEEMEVPILLVCQPKKIASGASMTSDDLRDSSLIAADADQVIILHRKRKKAVGDEELDASFDAKTIIRCDASRFMPGGETALYFAGANSEFTIIAKEKN